MIWKNNFENPLRGFIGEEIIRLLFQNSGYLIGRLDKKPTGFPDFICRDRDGRSWLIEVKVRADNRLEREALLTRESWRPLFIVINCREKPYIRIVTDPWHDLPEVIIPQTCLLEHPEFRMGIHRLTYEFCEKMVEKYLIISEASDGISEVHD